MIPAAELAPAFAPLPPHVLDRLGAAATRCRFRTRQILFRAGDSPDALFVVLSGRVRVSRVTAHHAEFLHTESSGGVLGEIPIFGGGPFPATAVALMPTECAKVPAAAIERLLATHPEFARFALARLAKRSQVLLARIDELTSTTIGARVARRFIERSSTDREFAIGMSQAALAEELGTAREVVVRAIGSLVRAGAVRRAGRSRYIVVDETILRAFAGDG